jgi:hypothetical protein
MCAKTLKNPVEMPDRTMVNVRISELCGSFRKFVDYYDLHTPFRIPGQLEYHRRTIERRRLLGSVRSAVQDKEFVELLWKTLDKWGMNSRSARLVSVNELWDNLKENANTLTSVEDLRIDDISLDKARVVDEIWEIIQKVHVTPSENKVVSGTKTMHHLFPDLVPPMDRQYTRVFFGWRRQEFQYNPRDAFNDMYLKYVEIALSTNPVQFVGNGWQTSRTKILDNAMVAYCLVHDLRPD